MSSQRIPRRVFLDSSTLQTLQDYGEFIYDGGEISPTDKIWSIPNGFDNIIALRKIVGVGNRGSLQLAISRNSLQEVLDRNRDTYLQWALEMLAYWEGCLVAYEEHDYAFSGHGKALAAKFEGSRFDYLSTKDARLVRDAVLLECDVFLTMEGKLPKNALPIEKALGIKVMQPVGYWELLGPWAPLLG